MRGRRGTKENNEKRGEVPLKPLNLRESRVLLLAIASNKS